MSSGLFSIARTALTSHQVALQTISHNIANAETPGYSRQETVLAANTPVRMTYGSVGTGVNVETIVRKRDILLDETFRTSNGSLGNASARRDGLAALEGIFGEPSDAGMSNALDQFWNAWSDLSVSPGSSAARSVVQQRGSAVANLFNSYDTQITQQRVSTLDRLDSTVREINMLANQVAELNARIVTSESGAGSANDLRDQRDLALDRLSNLAGTRVYPQANGGVTVIVGNSTLVDGSTARPLTLELNPPNPAPAVTPSDIPVRIRLGTSPDALSPLGGELQGLVGMINTEIPSLRRRLDALASGLVAAVNDAHTSGYVFNGNAIPGTAAGNFFDAGTVANPVRAGTIRLDATIAADAGRIAASDDPMAPTGNGAAKALSSLRTTADTVSYTPPGGNAETGNFLSFFRTTVTRLGVATRGAEDDATVYTTLSEQNELRRSAVSGVSTDEELVNMLRVQQSYTAATKLIKTADEMLQTLISLI